MENINKESKKEIDLLDIWRIAVKRKWIIVSAVAVILVISAIQLFTQVPLYRATATIIIENPSSNMLNINDAFPTSPYYQYDFTGAYFNTQLRLLTSRSLAERVARKMNLADRPEFQSPEEPQTGLFQKFKNFVTLKWLFRSKTSDQEEETETVFEQNPNEVYAFTVLGGLSVSPIEETRLVNVSYSSPHPQLAADVVNAVVEEFINYSVEMRYEATQQASEFLNEQIAQLRSELSAKEREIQRYGEEKELLYLSDQESSVVSKFGDLDSALTQAQIERIKAESAFLELRDLEVDSLPQYISNPVIQNLKTEYNQMLNTYQEKLKTFKPSYPEMVSLSARIDSMRDQLKDEIQKAVKAAESDYRAAVKEENKLQGLLAEQRKDVIKMNNNAILYNSLKIEIENKRDLLNSLLARQNETLVSARLRGLKSSNIKIIDTALVPGGPYYPNKSRSLMLGLLLGLFVGVGLAFLIDYVDNTIKDPEEAERLIDLPSLGVIPFVSKDGAKKGNAYTSYSYGSEGQEKPMDIKQFEMINHQYPKLSVSENYRTLRTSIMFSHAENVPKAISFTSAFPQEGKTATLVNTAVSFAQLNKKVLMIDADMRKPRLHKVFDLNILNGLSSFLTGKIYLDEAIKETKLQNMSVITSGPHPPNPVELMDTPRMKELIDTVKERFDFVFIDTPPVLAVVDSAIVSTAADGTVFIIKIGKTTRKAYVNSIKALQKVNAHIIGLVYNEMKVQGRGYYSPERHGYMGTYLEEKHK
ncbi:MAG: polysaccharide biosynthesis tyrosine autokinase [Candidatus Aminicenantes bacterium]|nr:polysaccharide biosynthesis tyrosine autokinase [Candidatus Aminicenantes bacterium]